MKRHGEALVGIDAAKACNAVAVAAGGQDGGVRYHGQFDSRPDGTAKLIRRVAGRHETLHGVYEAGPRG